MNPRNYQEIRKPTESVGKAIKGFVSESVAPVIMAGIMLAAPIFGALSSKAMAADCAPCINKDKNMVVVPKGCVLSAALIIYGLSSDDSKLKTPDSIDKAKTCQESFDGGDSVSLKASTIKKMIERAKSSMPSP